LIEVPAAAAPALAGAETDAPDATAPEAEGFAAAADADTPEAGADAAALAAELDAEAPEAEGLAELAFVDAGAEELAGAALDGAAAPPQAASVSVQIVARAIADG